MLDASAPTDNNSSATNSPAHKKKKGQNNNRRFWPQDFANMQPQIDSGKGCNLLTFFVFYVKWLHNEVNKHVNYIFVNTSNMLHLSTF